MEHYLETKTAIQDRVREAGFAQWTLLKPGFFMENFLPPSFLLPHGRLVTTIKPSTLPAMISIRRLRFFSAMPFRGTSIEVRLGVKPLGRTIV